MLGMPMYVIKQITPKAREWKGTQTKLRYFKSLGSLNQFKHIMIRKGETRVGKVPVGVYYWNSGLCSVPYSVSLSVWGCGHGN